MIDSEMASPKIAVTIGSTIAVAVPNANSRITTPRRSRSASLLPSSAFDTALPTYPPAADLQARRLRRDRPRR